MRGLIILISQGLEGGLVAYCTECGTNVPGQAKFCPGCGQRQVEDEPSPSASPPVGQPPAAPEENGAGPSVAPGTAEALEARIAELRAELESVEEAVEIQSFGFYRPNDRSVLGFYHRCR